MSVETWAVWCTPSTYSSAPASRTPAAIAARSGRVPIRLDAAVTATSRVSSVSRLVTADGSSSPVAGSNSAHRP